MWESSHKKSRLLPGPCIPSLVRHSKKFSFPGLSAACLSSALNLRFQTLSYLIDAEKTQVNAEILQIAVVRATGETPDDETAKFESPAKQVKTDDSSKLKKLLWNGRNSAVAG